MSFDHAVVEGANRVLTTFTRNLWFELVCSKTRRPGVWRQDVCLHYLRPGDRPWVVRARTNKHSGSLGINYGRLGLGGTKAMAVGQLALWIRGRPRVPLSAWRYWAGDKILLARERGPELVKRIEGSGYDDGKSTLCVLCGGPPKGGLDGSRCWWNRGPVTGPCCTFESCQRRVEGQGEA